MDLTGRQNGRGAYICANKDCLEKAIKTKSLEKTLKTAIDGEIITQLRSQLGEVNE